jgi:hypothetical protein
MANPQDSHRNEPAPASVPATKESMVSPWGLIVRMITN